jgi:hypothetical protein
MKQTQALLMFPTWGIEFEFCNRVIESWLIPIEQALNMDIDLIGCVTRLVRRVNAMKLEA